MTNKLLIHSCLLFISLTILDGCCHNTVVDSIKTADTSDIAAQREMFFGHWLGEANTKDGKVQKWLMHRRKDGTYTSVFRQFKDGKETIKQTEAGLWGYVNGIYFTLTREMLDHENFKAVDTTQGEYYDAYKVLKFDGKELTYKDLLYGNEYTVRKVPDNYIF